MTTRTPMMRQWRAAVVLAATMLAATMPAAQQREPFRASVDFVSTDVIVRRDGAFVPDLRAGDFRVYEDDVPQTISMFEAWIGGRSSGNLVSTGSRPASVEGLVLPARRAPVPAAGRLILVFIDDLHVLPSATPAVRDLLRKVRDTLIRDNDLVGFVSSGRSSIAMDPAYDLDHRRFNEAISKIMGSADTPAEIVASAAGEGAEGPPGLRYNAHVAFRTALETVERMSSVTDRRKVLILVSNGYNFNPFSEARLQKIKDNYADAEYFTGGVNPDDEESVTEYKERESLREAEYNKRTQFSFADLTNELAQVERAAQRANVTFYPIDPRGMIPYSDARSPVAISYNDWRDHFQTQINSLKVLAEGTGGFCVCEINDIAGALRRIDAETSDFYRIGYASNNPDRTKIRRRIRIEVDRPGLEPLIYRHEYTLPRPPR
jgi:VWFA-related protein